MTRFEMGIFAGQSFRTKRNFGGNQTEFTLSFIRVREEGVCLRNESHGDKRYDGQEFIGEVRGPIDKWITPASRKHPTDCGGIPTNEPTNLSFLTLSCAQSSSASFLPT